MNPSTPRSIVLLRVVGCAAAILLLAWYTNPSHLRHVAKLMPGPAPADLIDWSKVDPAARAIAERNHPPTSNTRYHDGVLFSTTTNTVTGARDSFGILGFVIDVRTGEQRMKEQREIDALKLQEIVDSFISEGTRPPNGIRPSE